LGALLQEHPTTVFNTWAAREQGLSTAAHTLSSATAALLARLTAGPSAEVSDGGGIRGGGGGGIAAAEALAAFDSAWAEYLALFAAWKRHDAAALEVRLYMTPQVLFHSEKTEDRAFLSTLTPAVLCSTCAATYACLSLAMSHLLNTQGLPSGVSMHLTNLD
jgi:hypothetical protein